MDTVATTSHISAAETRQPLQEPPLTTKDINDDVPTKKQCVNLPSEQMDEDRTSNYSFHDDPPGDEDDFTQVTVRKNRPAGIPLIIKPKEQGTSFWKINPNRIATEIVTVSQEKLLAPCIRKDGTITVNTATLNSTNRLLMMKSLVGIDVTVTVSESYTRNVGKVNNIPVQYSDYELLDYLKDAGVIAVQRQIAYSRKEDGSLEQQPTESVLLHFPQNHPMPARVLLGFTSHPVMEYFGTPVQCFRRQRHGHLARHCRGQQRCKVCAGPHSYKDCMDKTNPKCANCGGNHCASFSGCPHKKAAAAARKHEILNGPIQNNRYPSPNLEVTRPPLPPLPPSRPPPLPPRPSTSSQQTQVSQSPQRSQYSDVLKRQLNAQNQFKTPSHLNSTIPGQTPSGDRT